MSCLQVSIYTYNKIEKELCIDIILKTFLNICSVCLFVCAFVQAYLKNYLCDLNAVSPVIL